MISIRIVQLLIISICVKMSSNYKVGQVIEKTLNSRGPKTLPGGTPLLVNSHDDTASPTLTRCNLFWRYSGRKEQLRLSRPYASSFLIRSKWRRKSNALDKSKVTMATSSPLSWTFPPAMFSILQNLCRVLAELETGSNYSPTKITVRLTLNGTRGYSTKFYTQRLRPQALPLPLPFYIPFYSEKVPLSYTFYWQMIPLSHTKFGTLHPVFTAVNAPSFKYE